MIQMSSPPGHQLWSGAARGAVQVMHARLEGTSTLALPEGLDPAFASLIRRCTADAPEARPSIREVIAVSGAGLTPGRRLCLPPLLPLRRAAWRGGLGRPEWTGLLAGRFLEPPLRALSPGSDLHPATAGCGQVPHQDRPPTGHVFFQGERCTRSSAVRAVSCTRSGLECSRAQPCCRCGSGRRSARWCLKRWTRGFWPSSGAGLPTTSIPTSPSM